MSTIDVAKRAANWQHPSERNSCSNCRHVLRETSKRDIGKTQWRCARLGIYTLAFGLCGNWEAHR